MAPRGFSVADLGTMTGEADASPGSRTEDDARRIRRARGLPGGRAVVGAFLVAAAAVGVFAAFLSATAEPTTRYAVATGDVEVGTRLLSMDEVAAAFEFVPMDLPDEVRPRAISEGQAPQLVGMLVTSAIGRGDLLLASSVVDDARVPDTEKLSFALPVADAVGGALEPGERIDILATYGSGADAWTAFVARGVLLVDTSHDAAALGSADEITLTVAVSSLDDVQALGHAIRAAEVFVTRSTVGEGSTESAPGAYRPAPDEDGPQPDPAGDPIGEGAPPPAPDEEDEDAEVDGSPVPDVPGDADEDE
jgi:hypothetical protein